MGKNTYSKEQFLEYYDFKDEPERVPHYFYKYYKSYENLLENVKNDVRKGMRVKSAIIKNASISKHTAGYWYRDCVKELEDGKTDTPLIRLFVQAGVGDAEFESRVLDVANRLMDEGDSSMVQFLMKTRLGYKSTSKKEVEMSTKEDTTFNINIVDSKKQE